MQGAMSCEGAAVTWVSPPGYSLGTLPLVKLKLELLLVVEKHIAGLTQSGSLLRKWIQLCVGGVVALAVAGLTQ